MTTERNNPSLNGFDKEANIARLGEVVGIFKAGIDRVLNGEEESAVLFEGDSILVRDSGLFYQVSIGEGLSASSATLFMKFLGAIKDKGYIISSTSVKDRGFLEGETDASRYFRAKLPEDKFPIERTSLIVRAHFGSGLLINRDKFYFSGTEGTPLTERWTVEKRELPDLPDALGEKEKVFLRT